MSSFNIAIQTAIYEKLSADLSYTVYDDVPQPGASGAGFPYVVIGEDVSTFDDTDTELSLIVSITIHSWSRYSGRKEVKIMMDEIYTSLHRANLSQTGYKFITITQESALSQLDPDGETRHGIQTFNLLIEEIQDGWCS